jgi:hypothetical protein
MRELCFELMIFGTACESLKTSNTLELTACPKSEVADRTNRYPKFNLGRSVLLNFTERVSADLALVAAVTLSSLRHNHAYRARGVGFATLSSKSSQGPMEEGLMYCTLGSCDRTGCNKATVPLTESTGNAKEFATWTEPYMNPGNKVTVSPGASENEEPPEIVNVSRDRTQAAPRPKRDK